MKSQFSLRALERTGQRTQFQCSNYSHPLDICSLYPAL
jgi:hypothetical protein